MQVQIINIGGDKTTSGANDLIIYTPGGGVGPVYDGCRQQYGKSWYVTNLPYLANSQFFFFFLRNAYLPIL